MSSIEFVHPSPKEQMECMKLVSEVAIRGFGSKIPAEVLAAHDQALYIVARAEAPDAVADDVYAAAMPGFREAAEIARLSGNT